MKGDKLLLDNGKEYIVTDEIEYEGKTYLYMMEDNENESNIIFCEVNGDTLKVVKDFDLYCLLCKIIVASREEFEIGN